MEISQLQRLTIFLGHPAYSLSVVLFSLLVSSGVGSLVHRARCRRRAGRATRRRLLITLAVLVVFGIATPAITHRFEGADTPVRILIAVGILLPVGFCLGMAFPLGMRLALQRSPSIAPWLWGVNGATSVCASVLAVVIAIGAGISAAFWVGAVVLSGRARRCGALSNPKLQLPTPKGLPIPQSPNQLPRLSSRLSRVGQFVLRLQLSCVGIWECPWELEVGAWELTQLHPVLTSQGCSGRRSPAIALLKNSSPPPRGFCPAASTAPFARSRRSGRRRCSSSGRAARTSRTPTATPTSTT